MLEVFKKIEGYPDYAISNFGRVLSLPRKDCNGRNNKGGIFLKQASNTKYLFVGLHNNKKQSPQTIHRLVALHFIPNPFNLPYVDHIDQDRLNNQINNLRWVFPFDNSQNSDVADPRSKLQIRNISYNEERNKYVFTKCIRGKKYLKRFNTLEEAIEYKKNFKI